MPLPAMPNAVPWSGEVRTIGRPERDVDAVVEIERLQRYQRLVVIHANRYVVRHAGARSEQRIRRVRPCRVDSLGAQRGDGRRDDVDLLAAHAPVFAGVGIERGDGEMRVFDAEIGAQGGGNDS